MSVTDLTNTTWVFNSGVYVTSAFNTIYINFNSYHNNYTSISFNNNMGTLKYNNTIVYDEENIGGWMLEDFQEITITGGTDATNSTLISWLQQNATQQSTTKTYKLGWRLKSTPSVNYTVAFSFNESHTGDREYLRIYDGENISGTLLYEYTGTGVTPSTSVTCTTGKLYLIISNSWSNSYIQQVTVNSGTITYTEGQIEESPYNSYALFDVQSDGSATVKINYDV
jgi:hypothetical protein